MDRIILRGPEVKSGQRRGGQWRAPQRACAPTRAGRAGAATLHTPSSLITPHPSLSANNQSSTATVYLHGAHVTSWTSLVGEELLFMSDRAVWSPPKALRGGVPVCFPQFSDMGPMATQHGFARNTPFVVDEAAPDNSDSKVTLLLDHRPGGDDGAAAFPHPFQLRVSVALRAPDGALVQRLAVTNPASAPGPLAFTAALHTYFRVTDIGTATVTGLGPGGRFLDSTAERVGRVDAAASLAIDREVDRIYLSPPGPLAVVDGSAGRRVRIEADGLVDAVVWNPWAAKAAALADFGDDEFRRMVCVEPAAVTGGGGVAGLAPGGVWEGGQTLVVG
jgi:glucose-6-phosphate 1-epimerase